MYSILLAVAITNYDPLFAQGEQDRFVRYPLRYYYKFRDADSVQAPPASSALATGIFGRKSTEDIVHCLASPKISLSEARDVMYHALHILELSKSDLPYASTWDIMGIAIEVYK